MLGIVSKLNSFSFSENIYLINSNELLLGVHGHHPVKGGLQAVT
jgi:hypothetical protein